MLATGMRFADGRGKLMFHSYVKYGHALFAPRLIAYAARS
jgi:hypothetical protein